MIKRGINMENKFAEFYTCALQVNPYTYVNYRGDSHEFTEEEYNEKILEYCKEKNIKVVGLADHGKVEQSERLRNKLKDNDIVVFPGFEISSAEKIHMVCLFDEETELSQLQRYLGKLDITDVEDGITPSKKSCIEIAQIINGELHSFWYAAHITGDNGILKVGKMNHIWKSKELKAGQIPSSRENIDPNYKNIIKNKEPMYKRDNPIGYINARDVSKPEDILEKEASCLIKMSTPTFSCFKNAFCDPEARVKLLSDLEENHCTYIKNIKIFGGYLDGLDIDLSKHLNTFIGGRGTGKSTLLEIIRHSMDIKPKSDQTHKSVIKMVADNFGKEKGRIEIIVFSHKQYGKEYKIIKRYGEPVVIETLEDGVISHLKLEDIIPNVEIYGQNEIIEIASDEVAKLKILNRFLPNSKNFIKEIGKLKKLLSANKVQLNSKLEEDEEIEIEISKLPRLYEKRDSFRKLGIHDKLSDIEKMKKEDDKIKSISSDIEKHTIEFKELDISLDEEFIKEILNSKTFESLKEKIENYNNNLLKIKKEYDDNYSKLKNNVECIIKDWRSIKENIDTEIEKSVKLIRDMNGKKGAEIASEYENTISNISRIEPLRVEKDKLDKEIQKLQIERKQLLENRQKEKDSMIDNLRKTIKNINKKQLKGKVRIELQPNKNREELIKFLSNIEGIGQKSLSWINDVEDLTIPSIIENIKQGKDNLLDKYKNYGLTSSKAEIISNLSRDKLMDLEVIDLLDVIDIQLNVSKDGEKYKSLSDLSKGQQCTAILYILLLDNKDPLIIDQPEDNLDNSFIANNLVEVLRENKLKRQFLFSTHNANIPVFGDAECICLMEEIDGQGVVDSNKIGSIDSDNVANAVINTLEGGKIAFNMRKEKYNF
jgi:ABC-type lipoprotein export system ATPase subunit